MSLDPETEKHLQSIRNSILILSERVDALERGLRTPVGNEPPPTRVDRQPRELRSAQLNSFPIYNPGLIPPDADTVLVCRNCDGSGKVEGYGCPICRGSGEITS